MKSHFCYILVVGVLESIIIGTTTDTLDRIHPQKLAFATVAVGERPEHAEPYLLSALVMGQALRDFQSPYPLAVLVSAWDVKSQRRLKENCRNCIAHLIAPVHKTPPGGLISAMNWVYAWTKLHLWDLPYDKVVFLDADVVIMKNIDALFEYPSLTLARNRCGLCCSHALNTRETYSTGMMVLKPDPAERYGLEKTLERPWEKEQDAIQALFVVAAVLPDIDNVFTVTTLASCGCRPGHRNSSYVTALPAVAPYQNKVSFTPEFEYFSGVRDDEVRTAHLYNPKPWYAQKRIDGEWDVPCGGQFYNRWHELLGRAMNDHTSIELDEHSLWFQSSVHANNSSLASKMKEALQKCPTGTLRKRLSTVASLLWSPYGLGMSGARAIRKLLKPWMLSHGMEPPMKMQDEVDRCIMDFIEIGHERIEERIDHQEVMSWVSYVLASVAVPLPSCDGPCFLGQIVKIIMALLQGGFEKLAESFFYKWRRFVLWKDVWQLPPLYEPSLRSYPVWDVSEHFGGEGFIPKLVSELRLHWRELASEYQTILKTDSSASRLAYPNLNLNAGNWTKVMLYDGEMGHWMPNSETCQYAGETYPPRELHPRLCERLPFTCKLIRPLIPGIVDPTLPYVQADQEQVNFFSLAPGSRLLWHSAVQNGRLTIHTCLSGCSEGSFLQVGPHKIRWRQGEPIIFDDSFFHHVQIDPELSEPRVVFHVMVMHPDLDTKEKYRRLNPKFSSAF